MRILDGVTTIDDVEAFVAELAAIGEAHHVAVQAFDARYVAGREHLEAAVERANRAFDRDDAIADDRAVEILCYAAGRRQIERAMEMGVETGNNAVVVVVDGTDEAGAAEAVASVLADADVLGSAREPTRIREFFDVSEAELGATDASLTELVVDRVSLLAVEK